jgi:hypothetical protein
LVAMCRRLHMRRHGARLHCLVGRRQASTSVADFAPKASPGISGRARQNPPHRSRARSSCPQVQRPHRQVDGWQGQGGRRPAAQPQHRRGFVPPCPQAWHHHAVTRSGACGGGAARAARGASTAGAFSAAGPSRASASSALTSPSSARSVRASSANDSFSARAPVPPPGPASALDLALQPADASPARSRSPAAASKGPVRLAGDTRRY